MHESNYILYGKRGPISTFDNHADDTMIRCAVHDVYTFSMHIPNI